jgi:hypothetical protein
MNEAQRRYLEELGAKKSQQAASPKMPNGEVAAPEETFVDFLADSALGKAAQMIPGQAEMAATLVTGAIADPVGKVVDIASTPFVGVERGTELGRSVSGAMTYTPRTEVGQRFAQQTGEFFQPVGEFFQGVGQTIKGGVESATGSEMAGEMTKDILSLTPDVLALGAAKGLSGSIVLKDSAGNPTPALRQLLNRKGLNYEALTPEAKASIPDKIPKDLVGKASEKAQASAVTKADIESGGRQGGLATSEVTPDGKLKIDTLGKEAVRQGWDEGFVQAVKSANPATQKEMMKMLRLYEQFKADKSIATRPSDIAGQAVTQRVNFIKSKISEANATKNKIAREKFPGMSVDVSPVAQKLQSTLDELDIRLLPDEGGVLRIPEFRGSAIQADRAAQRMIKDALDLMNSAKLDAAGLHRLKLQFDNLIDYGRSQQKLTPAGEQVVKGLRNEMNTVLRTLDPKYAAANDVVSRGLSIFEDLRGSAGTKVDLFADTADKMVGQQLRRLFGNTQARIGLEESIKAIDDFSNQLATAAKGTEVGPVVQGAKATPTPKFETSAYDLALFANNLDRKFGARAETSFQGLQEAAIDVATGQPSASIARAAAAAGKRALDGTRGVDEFSAFRALEEVLKRGSE